MLIFLKTVEFLLDVLLLRFVGCNNCHIAGFAGPFSQQALVYLSSRLTVPPIIMVSLDNENVRKKPNENYNNSSKGTKISLAHGSWDQTQGLHRKSGGKTWRTTGWNPKHPGVFKRLVASGGDENPELHKPNENCLHASNIKHPWKKPWVPDASHPRCFNNDICFTWVLQRCVVLQHRRLQASLPFNAVSIDAVVTLQREKMVHKIR